MEVNNINSNNQIYEEELELQCEIDYSDFTQEEAMEIKRILEEVDKEFNKSEGEINKHLTKDPEYMRDIWYQNFIELGWSHEEATNLAAKKVKERFGI